MSYQWMKKCANGLFSTASLIFVPGLLVLSLYWLQASPKVGMLIPTHTSLSVNSGDSLLISKKVDFDNAVHTATNIELIDANNRVVEYFHKYVTSDKSQDVMILTSPNTPTGTYKLVGKVDYLVNPLKQASINVELAVINVHEENAAQGVMDEQ